MGRHKRFPDHGSRNSNVISECSLSTSCEWALGYTLNLRHVIYSSLQAQGTSPWLLRGMESFRSHNSPSRPAALGGQMFSVLGRWRPEQFPLEILGTLLGIPSIPPAPRAQF